MEKRPGVGVGVIVLKEGKVLLGKRNSKHGNGVWGFPGGKLEFGEEIEECAKREAFEEANITIKNIRYAPFTNDYHEKEDVHFVTLFVVAEYDKGTVRVMEPDKCEKWEWFSWENLPQPLFLPVQHLLKQRFSPFA